MITTTSIIKGFLKENAVSMFLAVGILTSVVFLEGFYVQANSHIEGKWVTGCQVKLIENSTKETIQITKDFITTHALIYSDAKCQKPMLSLKSARTTKFVRTNVLETTVTRGTYEVLDATVIPSLNAGKFFGFSDWKLSKEYDITGKSDNFLDLASFPAVGTKATVRVVLTDSALAFTTLDSNTSDKPLLTKVTDAQ